VLQLLKMGLCQNGGNGGNNFGIKVILKMGLSSFPFSFLNCFFMLIITINYK